MPGCARNLAISDLSIYALIDMRKVLGHCKKRGRKLRPPTSKMAATAAMLEFISIDYLTNTLANQG
jgi:hypothetical protein